MDLLKANIFRGGLFKQAKFLVSTPLKAQKCIYISEAGTVSQEVLPINTGFVTADNVKKAWLVIHPLKQAVLKDGKPHQEEAVLSLSDRSYFPLDPQGTIKPAERDKLIELKRIAKMRHAQARADMGQSTDPQANLANLIVTYGFIILAFIGLSAILMKSCGG